ncbi:MAG: type II toxin-antitoxin system HipA family toxin [Alphaproteobacteria bacterium]|nr:type II toxin-antitoxin system HipA family toxin [Alphaproteobacteria bacterium]
MKKTLDVYLRDRLVGKLFSEQGTLSYVYDAAYLQSSDAVKISVSLPLGTEEFSHSAVAAFFSGLLPDEAVRVRLAKYLGLSDKNIFGLLEAIGGDCAGAISVYPEGKKIASSVSPTYKVLSDDEADEILSSLDKRPMLVGEDDVRISGAGAQDKLMIAFVDGKIAIPTGQTPSTHIIKPPIKGHPDSVHNEFFCMRLAAAVGLPVPKADIYWLKDKPYYLVERYDRRKNADGVFTRLHQEDFCQALHVPPELKYENEGGPSLEQCFGLLDTRIKSGSMAGKNKITLLQGVIFNYLIGNGDAHGKNFSLLYDGEAESLAPFYDLLSTVIYSDLHKVKMAMKIGGTYKFTDVTDRHWMKLAETIGVRPDFMERQILTMANALQREIGFLYNELNDNPLTASSVYEKIINILAHNHKYLRDEIIAKTQM